MTLTDFLTGIANAIRAKKGTTEPIPAANFAAEIASIEGGGGDIVDAVLVPLEITENGTYAPPAGAHGFSSVLVNVEQVAEEPVLAPLEITQNGVYIPGDGVDGFSSVNVNVPSADIERGIVVNAVDSSGNWTDIVVYGAFQATMFKGNTKLQKVALVNANSIPANAFDGCTAMTTLTISGNVTSIGNYAFRNCSALTTASIPETVTSIGTYAFQNCAKLVSVNLPSGLTGISNYAFYGCTSLTRITIPDSVTSIGQYAFYGDTALESVVIGNGVKTIGNRAFEKCTALASASLPDGLTSIGDTSFGFCGLVEISIPASVKTVANYAFGECPNLKTVYWNPVSVSSVASYNYPPFTGCPALTVFRFADGVKTVPANILRACPGLVSITLPDSVTTIGSDSFYGCANLESVNIPAGVTSIGANAFGECPALTTVYWNAVSASSIGTSSYPAFNKCSALTNFIIAEGVVKLPSMMLQACTGITSITVPGSVESIGSNAFATSTLTDITIKKTADSISGSPWGATSATITWAV